MAKTKITNVSGGVLTLLAPYTRLLRPGESVVVIGTPEDVATNLGGERAIIGIVTLHEMPEDAEIS